MIGTMLKYAYSGDRVIMDLGRDMGWCELNHRILKDSIYDVNVDEVSTDVMEARRYLGKVAGHSISIVDSHGKDPIVDEVRNGLRKIDTSYKNVSSVKEEKLNTHQFLHEFTRLFIDMDQLLSYFSDAAFEAYKASLKSETNIGYGLIKKEYDSKLFKTKYSENLIATKGIMPEITKPPAGKAVTETEATGGETT